MLNIARVKAISLDLDDTLWPIWPTIERAEKVLHDWLVDHAPMAAALFSSPSALREIRDYMAAKVGPAGMRQTVEDDGYQIEPGRVRG